MEQTLLIKVLAVVLCIFMIAIGLLWRVLSDARSELKTSKAALAANKSQISSLSTSNSSLTQSVHQSEERFTQLTALHDEAKKQISELHGSLNDAENEIKRLTLPRTHILVTKAGLTRLISEHNNRISLLNKSSETHDPFGVLVEADYISNVSGSEKFLDVSKLPRVHAIPQGRTKAVTYFAITAIQKE